MDAMEGSSVSVPVCRCCAAEGAFKDIKTSYRWMGDEEVYGDMLRECFDVNLSCSEQGGICEVCITQLRNAANFKKQVLRTETQFKKHLQGKPFKTTQVKEEMSGFDENDSDDMDNVDDEDYVPEFDVPIKNESDSEEKPKKRSAKAANTRAKKSKSSDDSNVKSLVTVDRPKIKKEEVDHSRSKLPQLKIIKKNAKTVCVKLNSKPMTATILNKFEQDISTHDVETHDIYKQRYNIRSILQYSNATPMWACFAGTGFACGFCKECFQKARDLKSHIIGRHNKEKLNFMPKKNLPDLAQKLDITGLRCDICQVKFNVIEELIDHLNKAHDKRLYTDIKNQIVCFKLDGDALKCMFCQVQFIAFRALQIHMNEHCKNFICEICAAGFVNQATLDKHMKRHIIGKFKCRSCDKIFDTETKMLWHEKKSHARGPKFKCPQCGEEFITKKLRKHHLMKMHGAKFEIKCPICNKLFTSRSSFWVHKKRDHLLERNYVCEVCNKRFFSKAERDNHMSTHLDAKVFFCNICGRAFKSKRAVSLHKRTHPNDTPNSS